MNLADTTLEALRLLVNFDADLWEIVAVSFSVSITAISLVVLPAILMSFVLAYTDFRGKWFLLSIVNTLQAVPTVVIGLLLYMLLSRAGPWGDWANAVHSEGDDLRPNGDLLPCFGIDDAWRIAI